MSEEIVEESSVGITEEQFDSLTDDQRWELIRQMGEMAADRDQVWAGVPMWSEYAALSLHPRYPYQGLSEIGGDSDISKELNDHKFLIAIITAMDRMHIDCQNDDIVDNIVFCERFYCSKIASLVIILEFKKTGKRFCATIPYGPHDRLEKLVSYLGIQDSWELDAELKAQGLLKTHISDRQWRQFVLTGTFLERSPRSNIIYMFRRGRPTLAQSGTTVIGINGQAVFLAALCSHGIGYYSNTFGGAMTPTDDLISHLLLMRADEWRYWKQSEQHSMHEIESGI